MSKLLWSTDTHLNFLKFPNGARAFGEYLRKEQPADALLVTGDISEGLEVDYHILEVQKGFEKPVYFVLGNHDYYRSSFSTVDAKMASVPGWLTNSGVVEISEGVALVGNEGWYDGEYGHPYARFGMADWSLIGELKSYISRDDLLAKIRARTTRAVSAACAVLEEALAKYELVLFATHIPPFRESAWHEGKMSDNTYLPWFSSKRMGDMLLQVAEANPTKRILVMCGHSHSFGTYDAAPNLKVLTGKAIYGSPDLAGVIEMQGIQASISMRDKSWLDIGVF